MRAVGLEVISVDYRLAPEHVAPAPIEDGIAAIGYALAGARHKTIILCGDSAGAAIALAVASRCERVAGVAACYGSYGLLESESLRLFGSRADGIDPDCIRRMWTAANESSESSPYAVETIADAVSVPVYVLAAERDPVRDDSLALARALKERGCDVSLDVVSEERHGFLHGGLDKPVAAAALGRISHWMRLCEVRRSGD
jgi:acetyl esterase